MHLSSCDTNTSTSEIRTAISALTDATEAKFGSTKRSLALIGLFWLRFVCPTIVDPFQAGVLKRSSCTLSKIYMRRVVHLDVHPHFNTAQHQC